MRSGEMLIVLEIISEFARGECVIENGLHVIEPGMESFLSERFGRYFQQSVIVNDGEAVRIEDLVQDLAGRDGGVFDVEGGGGIDVEPFFLDAVRVEDCVDLDLGGDISDAVAEGDIVEVRFDATIQFFIEGRAEGFFSGGRFRGFRRFLNAGGWILTGDGVDGARQ